MNSYTKRMIGILLSVMIAVTYFPAPAAWAVTDASNENKTEAAAEAAASVDNNETSDSIVSDDVTDITDEDENEKPGDEITDQDAEENGENTDGISDPDEAENNDADTSGIQKDPSGAASVKGEGIPAAQEKSGTENTVTVDDNIDNGIVELTETGEGKITGTATPDSRYDLATIRQIWTDENGAEQEQYLDYTYNSGSYSFEVSPVEGSSRITAFFYSLDRWDGAVDVTWYDPDETVFEIGNPAQLAGLAAIVNGMVDTNVTGEYMIKDNEGRKAEDGEYTHEYISTEPAIVDLLTPNNSEGAGQVRDTAWRLPEVEHNKVGGAADDIHNDFLYRTVLLTSDIDMGDKNWTPIGGKYAMNRDALTGEEAKVIDTRFQGVLDGQGHSVTISCDRQAKMGFAYAMEIAFIGYLGGGVDYENGYPKDTYMDYENYWVPTVRNVAVFGSVKGRRMVAGVVGRTGETNYGVLVENCANFASVEATDMRGCAGIVGAAWGKTIIRNCYNRGTIHSNYWEHGGIVGSNGYEGSKGRTPEGADVYNCYNAAETAKYDRGSETWKYDGQEIGVDGEAFAGYRIVNCYYETPESEIADKTGFSIGETSKNRRARVINVEAADLKSAEVLGKLNSNGDIFAADTAGINDGYPVLFYQTYEYVSSPERFGKASVTIGTSEGGSISSDDELSNLKYGTVINLKASPEQGKRLTAYRVVSSDGKRDAEYGDFYAVTGKDLTVSGVFENRATSVIAFPGKDDGEDYYVEVTKVSDADDGPCNDPLDNGDVLDAGDIIRLSPHMKPLDTIHPDIKNLEYTGACGDPVFDDYALTVKDKIAGTYTVTGEKEVIEILYKPKTQGKRWTTVADTSWFREGVRSFTITNARQLAGVAKLCSAGKTFEGVTISLGCDISLNNTKANSGDEYGYERSWIGIGTARYPFKGTFNGNGHTIKHMHRNFASGYCNGSNGGLFGVTEGAKISGVNVEGGSYINDFDAEMECGFINGANGGGIAGEATDTIIENCTAEVTMDKAFNTGGITGEIAGKTIIRNCTGNCSIKGTGESIGGIVGKLGDTDGAAIQNCTNNGAITSTKWKTGGILGNGEYYSADIYRCVNNGSVITDMKGTSSYIHAAGGIIGYAGGAVTCSECINKGDIEGKGKTYAQGGIAGTILRGTIINCYNTGRVYSESTSQYAEVSGITNLGTNKANIAAVKNCYNSGEVVLGEDFAGSAAGGVIAYGSASTNVITNAFCSDLAAAGANGKAGIAGTVVPAETLKGYSTKLGEAFIRDLTNINNGYPVLLWQLGKITGDVSIGSISKSGETGIAVSWSRSGNGDGIELYRAAGAGGNYALVYSGAASGYTDTGLNIGSTYYYKARVYRTIDGRKYYGGWSAEKSLKLALAGPTLSSVKNSKKKAAVIKWKRVKKAKGYQIYRSTKSTSGFKKIATVKVTKKNKNKKTLSYTSKKLKKGKKYYYKIRYYKTVAGKKVYSEFSKVKKVKIKK